MKEKEKERDQLDPSFIKSNNQIQGHQKREKSLYPRSL